MFVSLEHKLIFVHIPRCAGTSVRFALSKLISGDGSDSKRFMTRTGGRPVHPHSPGFVLRDLLPMDFQHCVKFTVIRNPVDRLLSLYQIARSYPVLVRGLEHRIDIGRQAEIAQQLSPVKWITEWCPRVKWNPWLDLSIGDRSIVEVPQSWWVQDYAGRFLFRSIFYLNLINRLENWLSREFSVRVKLPHLNGAYSGVEADWPELEKWTRLVLPSDYTLMKALGYGSGR